MRSTLCVFLLAALAGCSGMEVYGLDGGGLPKLSGPTATVTTYQCSFVTGGPYPPCQNIPIVVYSDGTSCYAHHIYDAIYVHTGGVLGTVTWRAYPINVDVSPQITGLDFSSNTGPVPWTGGTSTGHDYSLQLPTTAPDKVNYKFAVQVTGTYNSHTFSCGATDPVIGNGKN
jgi:hypothetical protein